MSIAHKTATLLTATLLLMGIAVYAGADVLVLSAFAKVEAQSAAEHVQRVEEAFGNDLAALTNLGRDWSNWDDAYEFVLAPSQEFIAANLHGSGFEKIGIDLMLFLDTEGNAVETAAFDRHTGEPVALPEGIVDQFAPGSPLLRSDVEAEDLSGLLQLSDGQLMFTALPIFDSEFRGPSHGTLVLGKLLDDDLVGNLARTVHVDLAASRPDADQLSPNAAAALNMLVEGSDAAIIPLSEGKLAAFGLVRDVYGQPGLLFTIDLPRTIYGQGRQTIRYLLIALVAIGTLILAVIIVALRRIVLKRLHRLGTEVGMIGQSANLGQRVSQDGSDELAEFAKVLNHSLDALQAAQERLRTSEARNRALIAAMPDAIITFTRQGVVGDCEPASEGCFGRFWHPAPGRSLADALPVQVAAGLTGAAGRAVETDRTQPFEFILPAQGGPNQRSETHYEARVVRCGGDEVLAVIRDVTERRQLEEARHHEMLLREIHHRVKNNLQVISSLLSLQADRLSDPALVEMFRDSQNRVKTMALIHEKLYRSKDMDGIDLGEYLSDLVAFLINSYRLGSTKTDISVEAPSVALGLDKAVPCGLIVNELVSNALKHAFPNDRTGRIDVRLAADDDKQLELTISDDGVGLPKGTNIERTETLGLRLVRSLADQLDAGLEVKNGRGTTFKLTFAIE